MDHSHGLARHHFRRAGGALVGLPSGPRMTAGDLMIADFPVLEEAASLRQACVLLADCGLPAIPVTNASGTLLGTVSSTGLLGAVATGPAMSDPVSAMMDRRPVAVLDCAPAEMVLAEMDEAGLWALPVVDRENHLLGMVSLPNLDGTVSSLLMVHAWSKFADFHPG